MKDSSSRARQRCPGLFALVGSYFGIARAVPNHCIRLYVTGGVAFASIKHDFTITDPFSPTESFSAKKSRWGWVGGVGAEWAWTENVSIETEVLYVKFSEVTTTVFSPAGAQSVTFDHQDSMWVSRIGLNVKLGGPVVAKY